MADEPTTPPQVGNPTAHDRTKKGFLPEEFGDEEVTIDLDHPLADKVKSREELEADLDSRKQTPGAREKALDQAESTDAGQQAVADEAAAESADRQEHGGGRSTPLHPSRRSR